MLQQSVKLELKFGTFSNASHKSFIQRISRKYEFIFVLVKAAQRLGPDFNVKSAYVQADMTLISCFSYSFFILVAAIHLQSKLFR